MDNEQRTEMFICPGCGIHYEIPVQALMNNNILLCEHCNQPLLLLPDPNIPENRSPIC